MGSGAYGTVWRVSGHEPCAVKIIQVTRDEDDLSGLSGIGADAATGNALLERRAAEVLAEIEALTALREVPYVMRIDDYRLVELSDGEGYAIGIRMELLEPLPDHLRRMRTVDACEAVRVGIDVCRALEACHERGIVHRDVKPSNLFWCEENQVYKLGDFGAARRLERQTAQTMSRKGTGSYMAPEVYFGRPYSFEVDIYSLGIVLYRLLNDQRMPFWPAPPAPVYDGDVEEANRRRLMGETLPVPCGADADLARIVCKACASRVEERYAQVSELRADLEAWRAQNGPAGSEWTSQVPAHAGQQESVKANHLAGLSRPLTRRTLVGGSLALAICLAAWGLRNGASSSASENTHRIVGIAAGDFHSVGVRADGSVVACGNDGFRQCDVSGWHDAVAVAAGASHTVCLRADGAALACGANDDGQCNVEAWEDVVSIVAGASHSVGLLGDGTVVACGSNAFGQCDVDEWTQVVAVAAGVSHTVGLRTDGTVLACGLNASGQCDVDEWHDVAAVAAGGNHSLGLLHDGTIVVAGKDSLSGIARCAELEDTKLLATGSQATAAILEDGTVRVVGSLGRGTNAAAFDAWSDLVSIAVGDAHVLGVREDGGVLAVGSNAFGQCEVVAW